MLLKGKKKKGCLGKVSVIFVVCNSNVSNDCTISNVPSYVSIVSNCK